MKVFVWDANARGSRVGVFVNHFPLVEGGTAVRPKEVFVEIEQVGSKVPPLVMTAAAAKQLGETLLTAGEIADLEEQNDA